MSYTEDMSESGEKRFPEKLIDEPSVFEDMDETAALSWISIKSHLERIGLFPSPNPKILELGSGNGIALEEMKKEGLDAVGVDLRPRSDKDVVQVAARIEQLPFADESFDLIYSSSVFDDDLYKQDQRAMLEECARVLKKGGLFVGSVHNDITDKMPESLVRTHGDQGNFRLVYQKK